jgi:hypothetical protein
VGGKIDHVLHLQKKENGILEMEKEMRFKAQK